MHGEGYEGCVGRGMWDAWGGVCGMHGEGYVRILRVRVSVIEQDEAARPAGKTGREKHRESERSWASEEGGKLGS